VTDLEHALGPGWSVYPAGGATGEAYFAVDHSGNQRLFIKRNSSPFLAVLSAEGIVPKLLWTKRLESGDVITAQKWIKGRELKANEMNDAFTSDILQKIHCSKELLSMLKRIGKTPLTPEDILKSILFEVENMEYSTLLDQAVAYLQNDISIVNSTSQYVVCHCDVNHNNWILSEEGQIYLIDWEGAMIADPALDIGMLLYSYIPKDEWTNWLSRYGLEFTTNLEKRMHWYVVAQTVLSMLWHTKQEKEHEIILDAESLQQLLAN
jgi:thiamine kinase-like enzyme